MILLFDALPMCIFLLCDSIYVLAIFQAKDYSEKVYAEFWAGIFLIVIKRCFLGVTSDSHLLRTDNFIKIIMTL